MVPALPQTDIMRHLPDVDCLDLWASDYSWRNVPVSPGVYCFYDGKTGENLYIGSAAARSGDDAQSGLRMRLQFYRSRGKRSCSSSVIRVNQARETCRVLVRAWTVVCAGDARKYEYDAIELHRPRLNIEMNRPVRTKEEIKVAKGRAAKKLSERYRREANFPADDEPKYCPGCEMAKTMADFHRNSCRKDGRKSICRDCAADEAKQKRLKV